MKTLLTESADLDCRPGLAVLFTQGAAAALCTCHHSVSERGVATLELQRSGLGRLDVIYRHMPDLREALLAQQLSSWDWIARQAGARASVRHGPRMFLFCAPRHRNAAGIPAFALTKEVHVMKLKPREPAPAGGKNAERGIKRAIDKISE